jgi:hypothetical protein
MDNFNLKQFLFESRAGMYSKTQLNEHRFEDATLLGGEIAKAHPELLRFKLDGDTKKYQDAIFKYAGELLHNAGVSLQTVRSLAYDYDWARELVDAVGDKFEYGDLEEVNPAALGAQQDAADAKMQQQDDENGDMVDNVSMDTMAESMGEQIGVAYADKVAPAETNLNKYLDLIHSHDWFHHFADDPRAFNKGQKEKELFKVLYATLNPAEKQKAMDAYVDKYLAIHNPKQFPGAANNVKYLTTDTFKGSI